MSDPPLELLEIVDTNYKSHLFEIMFTFLLASVNRTQAFAISTSTAPYQSLSRDDPICLATCKVHSTCTQDATVLVFAIMRSVWLLLLSLRQIRTKLGGSSSYKPPGASYTTPGPPKQPELIENQLLFFENKSNHFKHSP